VSDALFLGVDGGATTTRAVVVDATGTERGRGAAGGANQSAIGAGSAAANVRAAAAQAVAAAGGAADEVRAAWVGLAGVDRPADREAFAPLLAPLAPAVRLTNDAALGLAALPGGVGVMLIAGTGAIALGANAGGDTARASGWGWLLGDEGSGFWLGLQALRAATRAADERSGPTALLPALLDHLHLSQPSDLIPWTYAERDNAKIAALAPLVFATARDGDATARGIVRLAVSELSSAVAAVADELGFPDGIPLALGGSLLLNEVGFRKAIVRQFRRVEPLALVHDAAIAAARGAIALARGATEGAGA